MHPRLEREEKGRVNEEERKKQGKKDNNRERKPV